MQAGRLITCHHARPQVRKLYQRFKATTEADEKQYLVGSRARCNAACVALSVTHAAIIRRREPLLHSQAFTMIRELSMHSSKVSKL